MKVMSREVKHVSVFGIFDTRTSTESAVEHFKTSGFLVTDISVLMPDKDSARQMAYGRYMNAPEEVATKASTGAVVGESLRWLSGLGALTIPGIGPVVAAGPIKEAIAGAGAGGSVGAVSVALVGLGMPKHDAEKYEESVKDGGILLSIHCENDDEINSAKQLLEVTGAHDIAMSKEPSKS